MVGVFPQTATYWSPSTVNVYGERSYGTPVQLDVRWQNSNVLFKTQDGRELVSRSVIYTKSDVELEGYLYLGTSAAADPRTVSGADRILAVNESKSIDGTETLIKAML